MNWTCNFSCMTHPTKEEGIYTPLWGLYSTYKELKKGKVIVLNYYYFPLIWLHHRF